MLFKVLPVNIQNSCLITVYKNILKVWCDTVWWVHFRNCDYNNNYCLFDAKTRSSNQQEFQ